MKEIGKRFADLPRELRHRIAVPVWEGLLHRLNLEFSEESRQNLLTANELLRQNSVVVYVNHTSQIEDVELPVSMVLSFLTNTKQSIQLKQFFSHPKIEVGKPLKLGEMLDKSRLPENPRDRAQVLANVHMQRLADMMPQEMRGVYNS